MADKISVSQVELGINVDLVGRVALQPPDEDGGDAGVQFFLQGGTGGPTNGAGGDIAVRGGTGNGGNGGATTLAGGEDLVGNGGSVFVNGGTGATDATSGHVNITGGEIAAVPSPGATGGDVVLRAGAPLAGTAGNIILMNLPTADPTVLGAVWNDAGTLKISAGA